jgi:hypothetical protein
LPTFVEGMEAMKVGNPALEETDIGPLATVAQVEELDAQVKAAIAAGARVLTGGARMIGVGNYYEPTVLAGVPHDSDVYHEETFGPVAMLFRVSDIDDAIEIANDTPFGLAASVWTNDPAEQQRFTAELQCGAVFVNEPVASDPRLPFGGIKRSGYGRELSAAGMREFLNAKTVVRAGQPAASRREAAAKPAIDDGLMPSRSMGVAISGMRTPALRTVSSMKIAYTSPAAKPADVLHVAADSQTDAQTPAQPTLAAAIPPPPTVDFVLDTLREAARSSMDEPKPSQGKERS